jgi:hypothetical protein
MIIDNDFIVDFGFMQLRIRVPLYYLELPAIPPLTQQQFTVTGH